jgi:hypothetical protein
MVALNFLPDQVEHSQATILMEEYHRSNLQIREKLFVLGDTFYGLILF